MTYRSANLNEKLADRFPVVHGVESCNLVHTHGWHLQNPRNLVHDTDASVAMLTLAKVKQRHDSRLLVLRGIALEDLIDEGEVLSVELEWERGVVLRAVTMLEDTGH